MLPVWNKAESNVKLHAQEALKEEQVKLAAALAAERQRVSADSSGALAQQDDVSHKEAPAAAAADPLDAFMTGLATSLEHDKVSCIVRAQRRLQALTALLSENAGMLLAGSFCSAADESCFPISLCLVAELVSADQLGTRLCRQMAGIL